MVDYCNLKVFRAFKFEHIKQDKLDTRDLNYIFIAYPKGVNGYKLLKMNPKGSKFIINSDITCNEIHMRMKFIDIKFKE